MSSATLPTGGILNEVRICLQPSATTPAELMNAPVRDMTRSPGHPHAPNVQASGARGTVVLSTFVCGIPGHVGILSGSGGVLSV